MRVGWQGIAAGFGVAFLCLALAAWFLRLDLAALRIPFEYSGDGLSHGVLIKTILDTGFFATTPYLGAPFGANYLDFPQAEMLHVAIIRLLGAFLDGYGPVFNAFYLLSFPLSGLAAYWVMRDLGLRTPFAVAGAVLFAFLPYHFLRRQHLLLASYFVVPFAAWLAVRVLDGSMESRLRRPGPAKGIPWLAAISVGSCGAYYAFFGGFFIALAAIAGGIAKGSWRTFAIGAGVLAIVCAAFAANVGPNVYWLLKQGSSTKTIVRSAAEAEYYGLKIAQLVLPAPGHRIASFAKANREYTGSAPLVNENASSGLGLVGTAGFLLILVSLLFRPRLFEGSSLMAAVSVLALAGLLLGTIGGFGSIVSQFVINWIRAYNRVSIFIAFFSLVAVLLAIQLWLESRTLLRRWPLAFPTTIAVMLAALGLFDQTSSTYLPNYDGIKTQFLSDQRFVREVERLVPRNARIYQLPYVPYPEHPQRAQEGYYGLARGYLHSRALRWSYGAVKGRSADDLLSEMGARPIRSQVEVLPELNFSGVYVERRGYADRGAEVERELQAALGPPALVSDDGHLAFYRSDGPIRSYEPEPQLALGTGFYGLERNAAGDTWSWTMGDAELVVRNPGAQPMPRVLRMELSTLSPRRVTVRAGEKVLATYALRPSQAQRVEVEVRLDAGENRIRLVSDIPAQLAGTGDPRKLAFSVTNPRIEPGQKK